MANKQIHQYTAATGIDPSADLLLIDPASSGIYNSINRNVFLGLNSQPLGLTDSQSPQNKVFDNTNSLTVKDGSLTIQNSSSTTKQAVFSASGITAGQTRTFTFPDASGTLVTAAGTQTLTNKTITSPVITGGTYDNGTITVDSISGHTSATIVTVANLQISNGVLNTNNSVVTANIADGAVTPAKLVSGTGSGWAWSGWTPTWDNLTIGNATVTARYIQIGKAVYMRVSVVLGSTSSVGSAPAFSLPVTAVSNYNPSTASMPIGQAHYEHTGVSNAEGFVYLQATTRGGLGVGGTAGTYLNGGTGSLTASVPFSWASGDQILLQAFYEAA